MKLSEIVLEKDEGKHNNGKTTGFKAVSKKAAAEYGSKEAGDKVAGAIRSKMAKSGTLEESNGATPPGALQDMQKIVNALQQNANDPTADPEYSVFERKCAKLLAKCIPYFQKSLDTGMQAMAILGRKTDDVSSSVVERIEDILYDHQ